MKRAPLILLSMLAMSAPSMAQGRPEQKPPQPPGDTRPELRREPPREVSDDPAETIKLLKKQAEEAEQRRERLRLAIQKIEQGTPVREALRGVDVRPDREGREGRGDGRRSEGPQGGNPRGRGGEPGGPGEPVPSERGRRMDRPPTAEEREHAKAFIREHLPAIAARMESFEKANPEMSDRGMMRLVPRIQEAEAVRKTDPKLFELRVRELAGQIDVVEAIRTHREANESKDQDRISKSTVVLRAALAAQFDTRLELQEHEIEGLTKRIDELKSDVQKKRSSREAQLDEMLTRIRDFGDRRGRERPDGEPHPKDGETPRKEPRKP